MSAPRAWQVPLEYSDGTSPTKAIVRGAEAKRRGSSQFGRNGQRGEIVDPPKTAQPLDVRAQRLQVEPCAQVFLNGAELRDDFINGPPIRAMGVIECRQGPGLLPQPCRMSLGPRLLRPRESATMSQEEFGQAVSRPQEFGAKIFTTAEQIPGRLFPVRWECESP